MIIGAVRETSPGEKRVAATPQSVKKLISLGYQVIVETNSGAAASFDDAMYEQAGAEVIENGAV